MGFNATDFLAGLFSEAAQQPAPEGAMATDDPLAADPFAGWVRRRDVAGRWGWEAPDLPEWQRWWARCRFDDLPEAPMTGDVAGSAQPTPQDARSCVPRAMVDTLHLSDMRPRDSDCATLKGIKIGKGARQSMASDDTLNS